MINYIQNITMILKRFCPCFANIELKLDSRHRISASIK